MLCGFTKAGQTDITSAKCLINSISRFIHLVSCRTVKPMPLQKNCNNMVGVLKCLKPVLDDVVDCQIPLDENLYKECEELDMQVNEAREFIEKWGPKMSKIHSVSSYLFILKLMPLLSNCYFKLCRILNRFVGIWTRLKGINESPIPHPSFFLLWERLIATT